MNKPNDGYSLLSNTLDSFKSLIGYNFNSCRVVFDHEGDEIVFVNDAWIGRVRIYLNGSLAYSGWDWTGMTHSAGWFLHQGKTYKITSKVMNLLTFSQHLTLSVDDEEVGTKTDEFYGKLSFKEVVHMLLGAGLVGFLLVAILSLFGV